MIEGEAKPQNLADFSSPDVNSAVTFSFLRHYPISLKSDMRHGPMSIL